MIIYIKEFRMLSEYREVIEYVLLNINFKRPSTYIFFFDVFSNLWAWLYIIVIYFFFLLSRRPRSFQLRFCRTCGSAYSAYVLYVLFAL